MKSIALVCLVATIWSTQASADDKQALKTQKDKISYGIGVDLVKNFKQQGLEVDLELVIRGMRDGASGTKLLLNETESRKMLADYNRELKSKQAKLRDELAEKNRKEGETFLAANKGKEGVMTTSSGLQYKVIKVGKGSRPKSQDGVTVKYRGTLLDGTEFDSSERIGYPVTFFVKDSVIKGWSEALMLMPAGSKWQIYVPAELGYGENGAGKEIGPNATLIYDIELIAVNPEAVTGKIKDLKK